MVKPVVFFIVGICVFSFMTENVVGKSCHKHRKQHSKKPNYEASCPGQCVPDCCGIPLEGVGCSEGTVCCTSRDESINAYFYSFGVNTQDNCITDLSSVWESEPISVTVGMPYYGHISTRLFIDSDGMIYTGSGPIFSFFNNMVFPNGDGFIWYRAADTVILNQISTDIQSTFGESTFVPTFALVTTFDNARLSSDPDLKSTFQYVLATDGTSTYATFVYDDINFEARIVGFDHEELDSFFLPSKDSSLTTLTNVGKPGKFVFKIDGDEIEEP